ncbi:MAG: PIN domain-containing protein [Anaerolineae bacterium]|nr:PIN domain-containing protein [Anaerolineae bacterium]
MSAEIAKDFCFVDSNVWLYIFLPGQDIVKAQRARQLVEQKREQIVVSTQIVNEIVNTLLRNAAMNEVEIRELIRRFYARHIVKQITESMQLRASQLREGYALSHWDSLIVSAALESDLSLLYSEDMQNGLVVAKQLTITNPFI